MVSNNNQINLINIKQLKYLLLQINEVFFNVSLDISVSDKLHL